MEKKKCSEALGLYRDVGPGPCPHGVSYFLMCAPTLQSRKYVYVLYVVWLFRSPESQQAASSTSPGARHSGCHAHCGWQYQTPDLSIPWH